MPIETKYVYVCNSCGRSKENDGVPDNWELWRSYDPAPVYCPVCLLKQETLKFRRLKAAAQALLDEEAATAVEEDTPTANLLDPPQFEETEYFSDSFRYAVDTPRSDSFRRDPSLWLTPEDTPT